MAHFHKTTISEIKRRYGSKLEKAEVPFLHEGKIALIIQKLQERRSLREKEFKVYCILTAIRGASILAIVIVTVRSP